MIHPDYSIPKSNDQTSRLARAWLWLGLFSLIAPGVFAILLVIARFPGVHGMSGWGEFFKTALVLHVDLSILAWFLAFGGVLWSWNSGARAVSLGWSAFVFAVAGTLAMSFAPLVGESRPLLNNYIPVLQQPVFLTGLGLFGIGVTLLIVRTLIAAPVFRFEAGGAGALRLGLNAAAIVTLFALIAFCGSYVSMPAGFDGHAYYELLFWGAGHVLQFTYTLLMLVSWCWLASASGIKLAVSARVIGLIFMLGFVPVLAVPIAYFAYDVSSASHRIFFTLHMQYAGGIAALPLGLILAHGWWRAPRVEVRQKPLRAALIVSVLLFATGGVIGYMISGVNVTIPAHYHGSIIGVTLAFMGLTYCLLPKLGYREPNRFWATIQPWLLGGGQLLHVIGLAWLGGYGVQRKVADGVQVVDAIERLARGVMNIGGLLAIAGGLMFLVVVFSAMRDRR